MEEIKIEEIQELKEKDNSAILSPKNGESSSHANSSETNKKSALNLFLEELRYKFKYFFRYNIPNHNKRVWELDILRGLLIIFVTICHFGVLIPIMFRDSTVPFVQKISAHCAKYYSTDFTSSTIPFGVWFFVLLSGISSGLAQNKFFRVLKLWVFTGLFMLGFYLLGYVLPQLITCKLIFNIFTVLSISAFLWWVLDIIHTPDWIKVVIAIFAMVVGWIFYVKRYVYNNAYIANDWLAMLVYNSHANEISRMDFHPLFPALGLYFLGGVLSKYLYPERKTLTKSEEPIAILKPIAWFGKHSLFIYLVVPTIVMTVLYLIDLWA